MAGSKVVTRGHNGNEDVKIIEVTGYLKVFLFMIRHREDARTTSRLGRTRSG